MDRLIVFTKTIVTSVEPERTFRTAEECLIEIRLVESLREASAWKHEYEVCGQIAKIDKFLSRIKELESS